MKLKDLLLTDDQIRNEHGKEDDASEAWSITKHILRVQLREALTKLENRASLTHFVATKGPPWTESCDICSIMEELGCQKY